MNPRRRVTGIHHTNGITPAVFKRANTKRLTNEKTIKNVFLWMGIQPVRRSVSNVLFPRFPKPCPCVVYLPSLGSARRA